MTGNKKLDALAKLCEKRGFRSHLGVRQTENKGKIPRNFIMIEGMRSHQPFQVEVGDIYPYLSAPTWITDQLIMDRNDIIAMMEESYVRGT